MSIQCIPKLLFYYFAIIKYHYYLYAIIAKFAVKQPYI